MATVPLPPHPSLHTRPCPQAQELYENYKKGKKAPPDLGEEFTNPMVDMVEMTDLHGAPGAGGNARPAPPPINPEPLPPFQQVMMMMMMTMEVDWNPGFW
jgi:hypothetical protein